MKRIQPFFSSFFYSVLECFGSSSHTLLKERSNNKKLNNRAVHFRELRNWGKQQKRRAHTRQKEQTHKKNLNWNFTINGKRRKLERWDLKERTQKKIFKHSFAWWNLFIHEKFRSFFQLSFFFSVHSCWINEQTFSHFSCFKDSRRKRAQLWQLLRVSR